jgi:hypothetical protein
VEVSVRNDVLAFILLAGLGCAGAAPEPAPGAQEVPATWPEMPQAADERKLLAFHDKIWELIGLSPGGARELNGIVLTLKRNIKYNENRKSRLEAHIIPGEIPRQAKTREEFFENHRNRFKLLGISVGTQSELFEAMERVWSGLHDPQAAPEDRRRAERIQELMLPPLPPCQNDGILEFRKSMFTDK